MPNAAQQWGKMGKSFAYSDGRTSSRALKSARSFHFFKGPVRSKLGKKGSEVREPLTNLFSKKPWYNIWENLSK